MSSATLQDEPWIDEFFNLVAVETLPLFEYLDFDFLREYDVFAPVLVIQESYEDCMG